MKKIVLPLLLLTLVIISAVSFLRTKETSISNLKELKAELSKKEKKPVDHSKFTILDKKYKNPRDVTKACISCHTERHTEIMESNHWNWETPQYIEGKGVVYLGKKNALNNFCIGVGDDTEPCAKCHVGFGMNEKDFSFEDPSNVDCLVCHDNSETYAKASDMAGMPVETLDLSLIAQSVGKPDRSNCGVCHFYGGGGDNVKHGDLSSAMFTPDREIDVHMAVEGMNFSCIECHETTNHVISGKMYSISSMNTNRALCEDCHTESPHDDKILDQHTLKVACQTCHIPTYAKGKATKISWDWSTAGKLKDGKSYIEEDSLGNQTYYSKKGSFEWAKNIQPDYVFFNGTADHYILGDVVKDGEIPVQINSLNGFYADKDSKIIPVKIHRTKQPYDPVNRMIIKPKLYAHSKGEGAYWKDFNWETASEKGMEIVGLPFSGKVDFVETEMYWPVNHQVAPKEKTVQCTECHNSENSRLAGLKGFYMPGRDKSEIIDTAGSGIIILSILGIFAHGLIRLFANKKRAGK